MSSPSSLKIIALSGSGRNNGFTQKALACALKGVSGIGLQTELVHVCDYGLPMMTFMGDKAIDTHPQVLEFRKKLQEADGFLVATPEYHGSLSGSLKNALDVTGFTEWEDKLVGLVGVSGGVMGGHGALKELRGIYRSLHAWVLPQEASVPQAWKAFDEAGEVKSESLKKRLEGLGESVGKFTIKRSCRKHDAFVDAWITSHKNPGAGESTLPGTESA